MSEDKSKLTKLTGSERQIAWAEKIRREKIVEVRKNRVLSTTTKEKIVDAILAHADSSWLIDNRNTMVHKLIPELCRQTDIEYTADALFGNGKRVQETIDELEAAEAAGKAIDVGFNREVINILKEHNQNAKPNQL